MVFLSIRHLPPLLALMGIYACSGDVHRTGSSGDGDSDESPYDTASETPIAGVPVTTGTGTNAGGGTPVGTGGMQTPPPVEVPGTGGETLSAEDIGLWCPTGDDWESLFGDVSENLGGAPTDSDCPQLASTTYSNASCSVEFAGLGAVFLRETGACCYEINSATCR